MFPSIRRPVAAVLAITHLGGRHCTTHHILMQSSQGFAVGPFEVAVSPTCGIRYPGLGLAHTRADLRLRESGRPKVFDQ